MWGFHTLATDGRKMFVSYLGLSQHIHIITPFCWKGRTLLTGAQIRTTAVKSSSVLQKTLYCSEIFAAPPCVKIILSAL